VKYYFIYQYITVKIERYTYVYYNILGTFTDLAYPNRRHQKSKKKDVGGWRKFVNLNFIGAQKYAVLMK